jgi:hypothetical protein
MNKHILNIDYQYGVNRRNIDDNNMEILFETKLQMILKFVNVLLPNDLLDIDNILEDD